MNLIKHVTGAIILLFAVAASAHDVKVDENLKYFVVQGKPKPDVIKLMVENPADPWKGAEGLVAAIPGAVLVDYYLDVGAARNLAIVAVPDSSDIAAVVYQRMGTLLMTDMEVFEVLPSAKFKSVLEKAKKMNEADAYLK